MYIYDRKGDFNKYFRPGAAELGASGRMRKRHKTAGKKFGTGGNGGKGGFWIADCGLRIRVAGRRLRAGPAFDADLWRCS